MTRYPYENYTDEVQNIIANGGSKADAMRYLAEVTGKTFIAVKRSVQRQGWDRLFHNSRNAKVDEIRNSQTANNPTVKESRIVAKNETLKTTSGSAFAKLKTELGLHENVFGLPEPLDDEIRIHKLPAQCNAILLLSDIHLPFHSVEALTAALKYGVDRKANTIYINGDGIDFYGISRFEKEKRLRNLKGEIEQFREFVQIIDRLFPHAYKLYKLGNHCARWSTYIRQNAKEFEDIDDFAFANVMRLNQSGWHLIGDRDFGKAGKLHILHGHELMTTTSPVNPARGVFLKAMQSSIVGHHHRTSEHSGKNISGDFITTWSTGCLSQLRPKYNPLSSYNHGFAFIEVESDGDFIVHNKRIDNGKIY